MDFIFLICYHILVDNLIIKKGLSERLQGLRSSRGEKNTF